jgi:ribosome-binding factor A
LGKHKSAIRHALGKELSLKYLPDLRFKEDTLFKQIEKTNKMFKALEKE